MASLQSKLKKTPKINFNANLWYELIDLTAQDDMQPPTTKHFSIQKFMPFITIKPPKINH